MTDLVNWTDIFIDRALKSFDSEGDSGLLSIWSTTDERQDKTTRGEKKF